MKSSAEIFASLIKEFSYKKSGDAPLCNFSFFLGAGFSKSWDKRFPVGNNLFTLEESDWCNGVLGEFLQLSNYKIEKIEPSLFKDIVYQIGMFKKYPDIRPRYIDEQNIEILETELIALIVEKFKKTAPLYYFNEETQKLDFNCELSNEQHEILSFFQLLNSQQTGSNGLPEGLRPHFITTNYDFTIDAILDNCLAPDDSLTLYTYRGITARKFSGKNNPISIYDNNLVNNLLKINGGFEIYKSESGYELDYREKNFSQIKNNPPQIMLPSREQDYLQKYFQALFPKVVRLLHETTVLIIVGYSLPDEDALIRLIFKQFAEDRSDGNYKMLFYIDCANEDEQKKRINTVFPHSKNNTGLKIIPYSGSFSTWAKEVCEKLK
jgi:hypothetical protein